MPDELQKSKFRNLPREERDIALRIARCRRYQGKTQSDLADLVGVTRDQIASIEIARATLPFGLALKVADALGVNLRWLAEGKKPSTWLFKAVEVDPNLLILISQTSNFLQEYNRILRDFFQIQFANIEAEFNKEHPSLNFHDLKNMMEPGGATTRERAELLSNLEPVLRQEMEKLPPMLRYELAMKIGRLLAGFLVEYNSDLEKYAASGATPASKSARHGGGKLSKPMLDNVAPLPHTAVVQNEIRGLKGLIVRLKKVTASRGAKAALAREFKVTRQAVNQWLSGESNPSADIAIRLQYWKPKLPEK